MYLRYKDKPFLRLLECYILDAIGKLPDESRRKLENMSPKLAEIYGYSGVWTEIIEKVMHFPEDMKDRINEIWKRNILVAEGAGERLEPEYFAQHFVDKNFSV
jgi:hypothetical protein